MARETVFIVQSFTAGPRNRLLADPLIPCKSADIACRTAERMAPNKIGVVAFSSSADNEMGDYDVEPVVLFRAGRLPDPFEN